MSETLKRRLVQVRRAVQIRRQRPQGNPPPLHSCTHAGQPGKRHAGGLWEDCGAVLDRADSASLAGSRGTVRGLWGFVEKPLFPHPEK